MMIYKGQQRRGNKCGLEVLLEGHMKHEMNQGISRQLQPVGYFTDLFQNLEGTKITGRKFEALVFRDTLLTVFLELEVNKRSWLRSKLSFFIKS
ncbi:hypothetical protein CIPAW_05G256000 [Carya illinoinensis]|uniref:Uncharacterized protein n=1 Tax=Carya illinoinensis TaxID=32201 RepID=A0A8T1QND7_CARIL|nr:hypothetical protein CIPAW_05G256000 [Carya illinoinensis]